MDIIDLQAKQLSQKCYKTDVHLLGLGPRGQTWEQENDVTDLHVSYAQNQFRSMDVPAQELSHIAITKPHPHVFGHHFSDLRNFMLEKKYRMKPHQIKTNLHNRTENNL